MLTKLNPLLAVAKQAFTNLKANDPIRMAGATAFFTFFALPPIIIMLSRLIGLAFNHESERVSSRLFEKLALLFGAQGANQLEDISTHLRQPRSTWLMTSVSIAILLLASTTLFAVIKNSLNQLWNVKARAQSSVGHVLADKVVALLIIAFSGLLFSATLTANHALSRVRSQLGLASFGWYEGLAGLGHLVMSVGTMAIWFAVVFKYLPDIRIGWKAIGVGAIVTGVLFTIGEQVLDRLLIHSSIGSLYGTSGAVILVLLFVFYASLIFYYGPPSPALRPTGSSGPPTPAACRCLRDHGSRVAEGMSWQPPGSGCQPALVYPPAKGIHAHKTGVCRKGLPPWPARR